MFALSVFLLVLLSTVVNGSSDDVYSAGYNLRNTRNVHSCINQQNVKDLTHKWTTVVGGAITASPTVIGKKVYVLSWGGNFTCLDAETGNVIWRKNIPTDYGFPSQYISRNTPTYFNNDNGEGFVFGVMPVISLLGAPGNGTWVVSTDMNGNMNWKVSIDTHPYAVITQSPAVDGGYAYIGVSSLEAQAPAFPTYPCCSGVGSIHSIKLSNGQIKWSTYTIPSELRGVGKFSGASVWNVQPAIKDRYLYVGTGQVYSITPEAYACAANGTACIPEGVWFDSILKIDKQTGAIVWGIRSLAFDRWNIDCVYGRGFPLNACPNLPGTDSDFSLGFILYPGRRWNQYLLGAGQKNGVYWRTTLDGQVVGTTLVGTVNSGGGLQGAASLDYDENGRPIIFVNDANSGGSPFTLQNGTVINRGHITAIDGWTGQILWERPSIESRSNTHLATTNRVLFVSTYTGIFSALAAETGEDLGWTYSAGHTSIAGPAISGECIFWGTGSGNWFNGNDQGGGLTAHCLPASNGDDDDDDDDDDDN